MSEGLLGRMLDAHNLLSRLGERRNALVIDAVINEVSSSLSFDEAGVSQQLEVMRNGRLSQIKLIHNIADAQRFLILR